MSQLPPCSRGGTVRAPSAATLALTSPFAVPACAVGGERRIGQRRHARRIGGDEIHFALVPGLQQLLVRQAADQSGMDEAGELHAGNVTRMGIQAGDVPDRLLRQREVVGQEAAAVLLGEEAVEAPQAFRQGADVEQIDHQKIAGLGALDSDRAGQEMHDRQIDVAHVVGRIVVLDEAAGPVVGLDEEIVAGFDPGDHRDVGMPAIVDRRILVGRFRKIDLDQCLGHFRASKW